MNQSVNLLERNGRREWAERLAHFHHGVDTVAHHRMARIGQYAAMAERSRAKLHSSPVPGDHVPTSNQLGCGGAGFAQSCESNCLDAVFKLLDRLIDVVARGRGPRNGTGMGIFRTEPLLARLSRALPLMPNHRLRPRAGHRSRRKSRLEQLAIGGAVEGNSASQGQTAQAGGSACVFAEMEQDFVQAFLERGRDVAMLVRDLGLGRAAGNEVILQITASRSIVLAVFARLVDGGAREFGFDRRPVAVTACSKKSRKREGRHRAPAP